MRNKLSLKFIHSPSLARSLARLLFRQQTAEFKDNTEYAPTTVDRRLDTFACTRDYTPNRIHSSCSRLWLWVVTFPSTPECVSKRKLYFIYRSPEQMWKNVIFHLAPSSAVPSTLSFCFCFFNFLKHFFAVIQIYLVCARVWAVGVSKEAGQSVADGRTVSHRINFSFQVTTHVRASVSLAVCFSSPHVCDDTSHQR